MLDNCGLLLINIYPISLPTVVNIIASSLCKCYFNFVISFLPSGYEMCLKRLCNLVKSRVLADLSIKIGEMVFRTFVHFFELFGGVFPQLFPNYF